MIMDDNAVIADILSHITLSNVRGVESADKWKDVISEFFCQAADDGEDGSEVEDMVAESDDDWTTAETVSVDVVKNAEMGSDIVTRDDEDMELEKVGKFK